MEDFTDIPDQRFINGAQWHILSYLRPINRGNTGLRRDGKYMKDYINEVHKNGRVVSIDCCLRRDGSIAPEQREVFKEINL